MRLHLAGTGGELMGREGTLPSEVHAVERELLRTLTTGAAVSAVVGLGALAVGAATTRPHATTFGRQTLAWAAIDGLIAAAGSRGVAEPPTDADDARARARRMRTLTAVNAVLDVGYVAGGVFLTRWRNPPRPTVAADGAAVILQGAFLLVLDTVHARRFAALAAR
ncbi:hypothetical protein C8046_12560 [Serinibacter arcticus]|uniref:Uncharacterized protein n=1 Tax=Serinibacter arcticus TaxID=1655435 RepID=A0A2U1ZWK8_9MICO|nr:hypothetical protein [Serinibacter arcticus]PWD51369.1 hypothetical protein C8046_12560 [Serinibacter arcticus]